MDRINKVLIFLLMCSVCYAENIQLVSDFTLKKPSIVSSKSLTASEQKAVESALKNQGRKLIHKELVPVKNDYQNDFDRGSVAYTPNCRNYSFHKVVIPDGTIIRDSNFSQRVAHTSAITGKNLTFIDCNLVNVELDPSWIVSGCNTCQIQRVVTDTKDISVEAKVTQKELTISHRVEKDGKFVEVSVDKETYAVGDDYNIALLRYQ